VLIFKIGYDLVLKYLIQVNIQFKFEIIKNFIKDINLPIQVKNQTQIDLDNLIVKVNKKNQMFNFFF
jgi:hypothetical protein